MGDLDLLPCPFCGGRQVCAQQNGVRQNGSFAWWEVACNECDIVVRPFDNQDEAIAAWNRRTPTDPQVRAVSEADEHRHRIRSQSGNLGGDKGG